MEYLNLNNYDKEIERLKEMRLSNWKSKLKRERVSMGTDVKIIKEVKKAKKKKKRKARKRQTIRSYHDYLQSSLWTKRKNRYFNTHGRKCEACNKPKYVTLHHAKYTGVYGDEPDNEVFALCHECHKNFHETHPLQKDMTKETLFFIKEVKMSRSMIWEMKRLDDLSHLR